MLEYPEAVTLAAQLKKSVVGKKVRRVLPPTKEHKFCFFAGDPKEYDARLAGATLIDAKSFGMYAEAEFDNGARIAVNDGVNLRLARPDSVTKHYRLAIEFTDGDCLVFTVAMYGGIALHFCDYDNEYYQKSKAALSPFDAGFKEHFKRVLDGCKPNESTKAFLATMQRFPGIGNGCLQDILFDAKIHPKRKLATLTDADRDRLFASTVSVLRKMTEEGGRDTEKNLYGESGGYRTILSKHTVGKPCTACGFPIEKETYMGGSVYFCPNCQSLL